MLDRSGLGLAALEWGSLLFEEKMVYGCKANPNYAHYIYGDLSAGDVAQNCFSFDVCGSILHY